ncbi:MAG: hypothetical protein U0359_29205 [Byssovorax sp.]
MSGARSHLTWAATKVRLGLLLSLASLGAACAPVPRPPVLGELDQIRGGAAAAEAKALAPQALSHAEQLRAQADEAFAAGDSAGAELLGERAVAAYAHAAALARIARAQAGADEAERKLAASKTELSSIDAEQTRVAAEAEALELRVRVARDAQPIQPSGKAEPAREQARLAAARALSLQAKLLCGAARLLLGTAPPAGSPAPDEKLVALVDEAAAAHAKVDAFLNPADPKVLPAAAPIDEATRARSGCLAALTAVRRARAPVTRAPGAGDALLAEISAMGSLSPSRDDRGVVVTLRGLFADKGGKGSPQLSAAGEARLAELGRIAAAHPGFPVQVVLHQEKPLDPKDEPAQRARAEAVARAVGGKAAGAKVEPILAGNVAPVADPASADRARNARVEVIFVTPETY